MPAPPPARSMLASPFVFEVPAAADSGTAGRPPRSWRLRGKCSDAAPGPPGRKVPKCHGRHALRGQACCCSPGDAPAATQDRPLVAQRLCRRCCVHAVLLARSVPGGTCGCAGQGAGIAEAWGLARLCLHYGSCAWTQVRLEAQGECAWKGHGTDCSVGRSDPRRRRGHSTAAPPLAAAPGGWEQLGSRRHRPLQPAGCWSLVGKWRARASAPRLCTEAKGSHRPCQVKRKGEGLPVLAADRCLCPCSARLRLAQQAAAAGEIPGRLSVLQTETGCQCCDCLLVASDRRSRPVRTGWAAAGPCAGTSAALCPSPAWPTSSVPSGHQDRPAGPAGSSLVRDPKRRFGASFGETFADSPFDTIVSKNNFRQFFSTLIASNSTL
jgi:hypothetical protein